MEIALVPCPKCNKNFAQDRTHMLFTCSSCENQKYHHPTITTTATATATTTTTTTTTAGLEKHTKVCKGPRPTPSRVSPSPAADAQPAPERPLRAAVPNPADERACRSAAASAFGGGCAHVA